MIISWSPPQPGPEAEFLDVFATKVLRFFLFALKIHRYKRILLPPPLEQKWFEIGS